MKEINIKFLQFLNLYVSYIDSKIETKVEKGGDGFFALELHKQLKSMGFYHEIVYLKHNKKLNDKLQISEDDTEILHCAIRFKKGLMINCKGLMEGMYEILNIEVITPEQLIEDLKDEKKWDTIFDRDQVEPIQALFADFPYDYGDFLSEDKEFKLSTNTKISKKTVLAIEKDRRMQIMNALKGSLGDSNFFGMPPESPNEDDDN